MAASRGLRRSLGDEDINHTDTTTLTHFKSKVNPFYVTIMVETLDEMMLHHDVSLFSYSELLTWIKERVGPTWKAWRTKEVDWGPNLSIPHVFPQGHHVTFCLRKERGQIQHVLEIPVSDSRTSTH